MFSFSSAETHPVVPLDGTMIAFIGSGISQGDIMISIQQAARRGVAILAVAATGACASGGSGLGGILGGVLGQGQGQGQVSGTVQNINTRSQFVSIQQSNGQNITLGYDNQTQVVYQNQNYSVSNLEYGDRVTARVVNSNNNNQYYTDLIQVDQSVSGSNNRGVGGSANTELFEGTVRQIDRTNGLFTVNGGNYGGLTVSLPYNPRQSDVTNFQRLRQGDYVRFYGVLMNNNRVELRQFN